MAGAAGSFGEERRGAAARRLRVLLLITEAIDSGGAERFAVGLATHLPESRFQVWMCTSRRTDPSVKVRLRDAGVNHFDLGRHSKFDFYRFKTLARVLRRERIDILHAHMFGSNAWGTLIGRACRVPVVMAHEQTWSYDGQPLRRFVDGQFIGRFCDCFVAVSSLDAQRMIALEGVPREKVTVIPNAYMPSPSASTADLRDELGIDASTPLIGTVAVMRPQKALSVMLEAYAQVLKVIPHARLVIAGDGECRGELEKRAHELGLNGQVSFLGIRRDVDAILRSVDVAAMSSDYEGTPLVALECIANRAPLVATAVGGLPEIIEDGRTGLLVPPRQPAKLAEALTTLLSDPVRRHELAAAAEQSLDTFRIETIAARFAELYEALVERAGLASQPASHAIS